MRPVRAVLFDFSTTLFHLHPGEQLLAPVLRQLRALLNLDEQAELRTRLGTVVAGGGWRDLPRRDWPSAVADAWARGHLHPAAHHAAYVWCYARPGCRAPSCRSCCTAG